MDENEFRKTYRRIKGVDCVFERIILTRRCGCVHARKFNLAEREGVSCADHNARQGCVELLELLHTHARFALQLTDVRGPLPHGKEIKVQGGGLLGLQRTLHADNRADTVENVRALIQGAQSRFGALDQVPAAEIVKSITGYQGRPPRVSR